MSLFERISQLRERARRRMQQVNATTERAVLDAGKHLYQVVETSRSHIDQLRTLLSDVISDHDGGLAQTIARLSSYTRETSTSIDHAMSDHTKEVAAVAEQARLISKAAAQIERTNNDVCLYLIHARIDSARSGQDVFKAIAAEMHQLAAETAEANRQINALALDMASRLPKLAKDSTQLQGAVATYSSTFDDNIRALERAIAHLRDAASGALDASNGASEQIIASSQAGISALQFQDVCAQSLLQIDQWIGKDLQDSVGEVVATGEVVVEAPEVDECNGRVSMNDIDTTAVAAGEVLMF